MAKAKAPTPIDTVRLVPAPEGWPEEPASAAYYGLAGEIVRAVEPHTEADPNAILIQLLIGFGNLIGRRAHIVNDGSRHYMNEFCVLAGKSGRGRKGTSWARAAAALTAADAEWMSKRIESGLSSGEGLIEPVKDGDDDKTDKRLLIVEPEFAAVLSAAGRQGNVLSPMIRNAWDTGLLQALTKSPTRASNAHISIIGHITNEELKEKLTRTEQANGFANRFIWICVRRKRKISRKNRATAPLDISNQCERFAAAAHFARNVEEIELAPEAEALWDEFYHGLPDETPGIFGALTGRAEGHVSRLASTYALLDRSAVVRLPHLKAAIALWEFSERCVRYIFGAKTGTPIGDTILGALRTNRDGMTRSEVLGLFHRHESTDAIEQVLRSLVYSRQIESARIATNGRPREVWRVADPANLPPAHLPAKLREMWPQFSDGDTAELWQMARARAGDCTAEEVEHFVALHMPAIRSGKITHPLAFIRSKTDWFSSSALGEYRAAQRPVLVEKPLSDEERQAEMDRLYESLAMSRNMLANAEDDEVRSIQTLNIQGLERRLAELEGGGAEKRVISAKSAKSAKSRRNGGEGSELYDSTRVTK